MVLTLMTACWPAESSVLGKKCSSTAACGDGLVCSTGVCIVDPAAGGQTPAPMNPPAPGTVLFGESELKWIGVSPSTVDTVSANTRSQPSASQLKNGVEGAKMNAETNTFAVKAGEICAELYVLKREPEGSLDLRIVVGTGDEVKTSAASSKGLSSGQWTRIFTSFKLDKDSSARLTLKETTGVPLLVIDDTVVKTGACTQ
jgi:hypothetical protein